MLFLGNMACPLIIKSKALLQLRRKNAGYRCRSVSELRELWKGERMRPEHWLKVCEHLLHSNLGCRMNRKDCVAA